MHSMYLWITAIENYEKRITYNLSQSTLKIHNIDIQHVNTNTWKEMCFEALLRHGIVRFEFNSHIVELGCDHFRYVSTTKFAVQFRLRGKATPNLHVIIFANLKKNQGYCSHPIWKYQIIFEKCIMFFPLYFRNSHTGINR